MKKVIYLGGAGGASTNNVRRSLKESGDEYLIGASSNPYDLFLANTDERYLVPWALEKGYKKILINLINSKKSDFLHFQHDFEIETISSFREEILRTHKRK